MMETAALFFQLFLTFLIIGAFTFGGGYAVMSLIHSEIVLKYGWISESTFTDIIAISQVTPGPVGLNCSTYVGYEVLKQAGAGEFISVLGSFTSSFAIVLPSFLIMLTIVKFYSKFHENSMFKSVMDSLKPAVAGMIAAAAFSLMFNYSIGPDGPQLELIRDTFAGWKSWAVFGAVVAAYLFAKMGPITLLLLGGLAGILIF
ncbi:MAG: chromate transporter [Bacteroidales bacterium]|nr:chromate transporter [Candidatus Cryptobacteroides equifaecalis]